MKLLFFTHEGRFHESKQMSDWLVHTALDLGLRGATVMTGSEGYGHKRNIHSARFFEPPDNPEEIVMTIFIAVVLVVGLWYVLNKRMDDIESDLETLSKATGKEDLLTKIRHRTQN